MPRITIDLSDEAYAHLVKEAQQRGQSPEAFVAYYSERVLPMQAAAYDAEQRLGLVRGFTVTVAQEMLKPLARIEESLTRLRQGEETPSDISEVLEKEYRYFHRLVDDLFSINRPLGYASMEPHLEEIGLREMIEKVILIDKTSTYFQNSHMLDYHVAEDVPDSLLADGDKFEQILHNIIGNALEYSPLGGVVRLQVSLQDPKTLLFAVSDQGIGITHEFLKRCGEPFARADNATSGSGIGLFLVKHFVEQHGGRLWAESEGLGKGTTVFFTLSRQGDQFPLPWNPTYQRTLETLHQLCERVIQTSEGLGKRHGHYDTAARADLQQTLQTELGMLQRFVDTLDEALEMPR